MAVGVGVDRVAHVLREPLLDVLVRLGEPRVRDVHVRQSPVELVVEVVEPTVDVQPVGLGARDSLRLEAGLPLHGQDIDPSTTPSEAALDWAVSKRRRSEGGFMGSEIVLRQLSKGVARRRVGILPDGRQPARAHTEIQDKSGRRVGELTSGGYGPTLNGPVAMGYVHRSRFDPGTTLAVDGTPATVEKLPFVAP